PDSAMTNVLENPIVIFSRPIYRDSVSHDTLYLIQNGEVNVSLTAMQSAQPTSLMVMPMPALIASKTIPAHLYVTEGVWDYRGNPVIATMRTWDEIGGAPATSAITPNVVLGVTPASASTVKGGQHFAINWPAGGENDKFIMAPASINDDSIYLDQINKNGTDGSVTASSTTFTVGTAGTFAAGDVGKVIETSGSGTAGNNGRRTILSVDSDTIVTLDAPFAADETDLAWALIDQIPFELYFVPEQAGNVAEIYPGRFIRHDAGAVRLTIRKDRIANLYTIASTDSDMVLNYTVETTAPAVNASYGEDGNGWVALSDATGLAARTQLVVAFNEPVDPASFVMGGTVTLTNTGGTAIGATISVVDTMVVIKPNAPLAVAGNPYALTFDGVTDTAGNALAAPYTVSFSIEETAPTILSVSPDNSTSEVSVDTSVRVRASEPMSISTITRSTVTTDGIFRVTRDTPPACGADAEDDVFGCLALDSSSRRVTFVPLPNDLHDETAYTLTIASTVSDLAGNTLGTDFTSTFDTIDGDDVGP
ncbi:MAG TPA: Ig-like domain-containing protein, partial [bacterium]|nr:Ig-like domain-containing protein [bacterium]